MPQVSTDLLARVQRLEDVNAIVALRAWYHRLLNDCRFDEVADLFTEDCVSDTGYMGLRVCRGREDLRDSMMSLPSRVTQIKQFIHSHVVEEIEGDTAKGWAILEARYGTAAGESYLVAGRYEDVYRRVEGRWLFQHLEARFYFSVPHTGEGWAAPDRHVLARREGLAVKRDFARPNPPF